MARTQVRGFMGVSLREDLPGAQFRRSPRRGPRQSSRRIGMATGSGRRSVAERRVAKRASRDAAKSDT
jgi:hypothetical protein